MSSHDESRDNQPTVPPRTETDVDHPQASKGARLIVDLSSRNYSTLKYFEAGHPLSSSIPHNKTTRTHLQSADHQYTLRIDHGPSHPNQPRNYRRLDLLPYILDFNQSYNHQSMSLESYLNVSYNHLSYFSNGCILSRRSRK